MASDDIDLDRAEIDLLLKELETPIKAPAPKPVFATAAEAAPPPATASGALSPGSRWSTGTLLMPAMRKEQRKPFAVLSAMGLPALPKVALSKVAIPALRETQWGTISVRTFVGLGVLFSAALRYWPYAHAWSWGLTGYMAAIMLLVVTGIWGAKLTWDLRLPAAHTVAVGTVVWGLGLIAAEWVPRIVYV